MKSLQHNLERVLNKQFLFKLELVFNKLSNLVFHNKKQEENF